MEPKYKVGDFVFTNIFGTVREYQIMAILKKGELVSGNWEGDGTRFVRKIGFDSYLLERADGKLDICGICLQHVLNSFPDYMVPGCLDYPTAKAPPRTKRQTKEEDKTRFPNICPKCDSPAYINPLGFGKPQCSNPNCVYGEKNG